MCAVTQATGRGGKSGCLKPVSDPSGDGWEMATPFSSPMPAPGHGVSPFAGSCAPPCCNGGVLFFGKGNHTGGFFHRRKGWVHPFRKAGSSAAPHRLCRRPFRVNFQRGHAPVKNPSPFPSPASFGLAGPGPGVFLRSALIFTFHIPWEIIIGKRFLVNLRCRWKSCWISAPHI